MTSCLVPTRWGGRASDWACWDRIVVGDLEFEAIYIHQSKLESLIIYQSWSSWLTKDSSPIVWEPLDVQVGLIVGHGTVPTHVAPGGALYRRGKNCHYHRKQQANTVSSALALLTSFKPNRRNKYGGGFSHKEDFQIRERAKGRFAFWFSQGFKLTFKAVVLIA